MPIMRSRRGRALKRALSVLVANGPFLDIHPGTMLTTPNDHPHLAAVDVRLHETRGPIGLITLKGRSSSPVAKLFLQIGTQVVKSIRPARSRAPGRKVPQVGRGCR
jgi:hypothetical protein